MLTRKKLSEMFHVSPRTIDRWIKDKGLPIKKSKLNGRVIIDEGEFNVWLEKMGIDIGKRD